LLLPFFLSSLFFLSRRKNKKKGRVNALYDVLIGREHHTRSLTSGNKVTK